MYTPHARPSPPQPAPANYAQAHKLTQAHPHTHDHLPPARSYSAAANSNINNGGGALAARPSTDNLLPAAPSPSAALTAGTMGLPSVSASAALIAARMGLPSASVYHHNNNNTTNGTGYRNATHSYTHSHNAHSQVAHPPQQPRGQWRRRLGRDGHRLRLVHKLRLVLGWFTVLYFLFV